MLTWKTSWRCEKCATWNPPQRAKCSRCGRRQWWQRLLNYLNEEVEA